MSVEAWKEIPEAPGHFVSSLGRVKSPSVMYQPWKLCTGYLQIKIKRKAYSVHRLVARAFCDGWFEGAVVNHKNGVRDDNRAVNLEWTTASQNIRHGYRVLGAIPPHKGKFSGEHNTSKAVVATCIKTGREVYYEAAMDAVRVGFDSSSISRCCHGEYKHHKGFTWRFAHAFGTQRGVEWSPTSLGRAA